MSNPTAELRAAQLRKMIETADEFLAMTQRPVPVDGIAGELDRALHIAAWRGLEARYLPRICELRVRYATELSTLERKST